MRKIAFRAWNKKERKMYPPFSLFDFRNWMPEQRDFFTVDIAEENIILVQFTGLLDKNGKEIYEGDIVKTQWGGVGEITFGNGSFLMNFESGHIVRHLNNKEITDRIIEVIGNIMENPNLLT